MEWSFIVENPEVISAVSAAISAIIALITLHSNTKIQHKTEKLQANNLEREKKLETLKAFNSLQKDVLSELTSTENYYKKLVEEARTDARKSEYKKVKSLISEIEHFASGVNLGLYDYDAVLALSGAHLYWLYKKVFPIIRKCRSVPRADKESRYAAFEALALRIKANLEISD